ncbi:putative porin [Acinetobacter haemolyticus]|uniref:putative porin n=1 Tax=Acinetobacter haemolyticus TaxID=29430 RepID=UPI00094941A7|nr:putative porin [Acinetobacter haemolyticus]APR69074.1 putative porin [Acinetobacter haemolyticus]ATZ66038.1 putative porin [Acinetobacter haemolyticus]NCU24576.1 putative porin [Acinetobacter haemolyticus]
MKKLSLITALLSSFIGFNANAYQAESTIAYEHIDMDDGKGNGVVITGKYYFSPIQTRNAPLAEAAFLNKASNIGGGFAYNKLEDDEDLLELQFNSLGVTGEVFIPDTQFYVSGALYRTNTKITVPLLGSDSKAHNGYALEAGFLPINGLLFAAGIADLSKTLNPVQLSQYGFVSNFMNSTTVSGEDDDKAVTLRAKYVTQLGAYYTNFEAQSYFGDETTYRLAADLYLDPTLSVGVSIADSTADESDSIFSIRAQKFFTPQVAVGVGYTTIDGADSFGINGTFRF